VKKQEEKSLKERLFKQINSIEDLQCFLMISAINDRKILAIFYYKDAIISKMY
jgi:hypothetical protein